MISRSVLVTDPALVKSASEVKALLDKKELSVKLRVPEGLLKKLEARSSNGDESFMFGKCLGPATLIGHHVSDSGLTCITEDPPYPTEKVEEEDGFDWTEFVMTTLSNPEAVSYTHLNH